MPFWLSDDSKAVWRLVVEHLKPLGIIGRMDTNTLARYGTLFVEWRKATAFVQQHGQTLTSKDAKGKITIKLLPQVRLMIALGEQLLRLEHEFGMTPAARASFGLELDGGGKKGGDRPRFWVRRGFFTTRAKK
jgi:P27 family predicted phage terminase small subunit